MFTPKQARTATDRAKNIGEEWYLAIGVCYEQQAHVALGYASWDDYFSVEFGEVMTKISSAGMRRDVVEVLHQTGMTTREIGRAVGVNHSTVVRDLQRGAFAPNQPAPTRSSPEEEAPLATVRDLTARVAVTYAAQEIEKGIAKLCRIYYDLDENERYLISMTLSEIRNLVDKEIGVYQQCPTPQPSRTKSFG